jgi:hypothetical protein
MTINNGIKFVILLAVFSSFARPLHANGHDAPQNDPTRIAYLKKTIGMLASDTMMGREAATPGERIAATMLEQQFKAIGLKPLLQDGSYIQHFDFQDEGNIRKTALNVLGYIDHGAKTTVVISAHYDHLGLGGKSSRSIGQHAIHPGADDNASGVAAMLELARDMSQRGLNGNNYLFIAFSGHEKGLFGSQYFIASGVCDPTKMNYLLNLDMVGRLDPQTKWLFIAGDSTSAAFKVVIDDLKPQPLKIKMKELKRGDHTVFIDHQIPVLFVTTGMHDDYHTVSDNAEKINISGLASVVAYLEKLIVSLDGQGKLEFRRT